MPESPHSGGNRGKRYQHQASCPNEAEDEADYEGYDFHHVCEFQRIVPVNVAKSPYRSLRGLERYGLFSPTIPPKEHLREARLQGTLLGTVLFSLPVRFARSRC